MKVCSFLRGHYYMEESIAKCICQRTRHAKKVDNITMFKLPKRCVRALGRKSNFIGKLWDHIGNVETIFFGFVVRTFQRFHDKTPSRVKKIFGFGWAGIFGEMHTVYCDFSRQQQREKNCMPSTVQWMIYRYGPNTQSDARINWNSFRVNALKRTFPLLLLLPLS